MTQSCKGLLEREASTPRDEGPKNRSQGYLLFPEIREHCVQIHISMSVDASPMDVESVAPVCQDEYGYLQGLQSKVHITGKQGHFQMHLAYFKN